MNKLKRHYFYQLQETAQGRWHPYTVSKFYVVTFFVTLMFSTFPVYFLVINPKELNVFTTILGKVLPILLLFQLITVIFYLNAERTIKYQKLQSYILPLFTFIFASSPINMYWYVCHFHNLDVSFYLVGVFVLLLGLIIVMVGLFTSINKIKRGELQRNGSGLYKSNSAFNSNNTSLIFGLALIVGSILNNVSGTDGEALVNILIFLIVSLMVYLPVMYFIPEFILLAYCKKRFTSFHQN